MYKFFLFLLSVVVISSIVESVFCLQWYMCSLRLIVAPHDTTMTLTSWLKKHSRFLLEQLTDAIYTCTCILELLYYICLYICVFYCKVSQINNQKFNLANFQVCGMCLLYMYVRYIKNPPQSSGIRHMSVYTVYM